MPPVEPGPATTRSAEGTTRGTPNALLLVAGVLLAARVAVGLYENRHPPSLPDLVRWRPIAGAEAEARAQGKPLLYDFTADWCPPCQAMKREVFADRAAAERIERLFVPVRVLDRAREEGRNPAEVDSLQRRFHIGSFPTLVVVPPAGGDSVILVGYQGKGRTLQALAQAHVQIMMPDPRSARVPRLRSRPGTLGLP